MGLLTDDQYKLIQLAAGKSASNDDKSEKIGLFKQILTDYYKVKAMQTQVQIDLADRAWEWLGRKVKSANKLPADWPGTDYRVSWNDKGTRKDSFMEFYRLKLKNFPEPGWNIMLMDGHTRSGDILEPHMVVMYVRDDGLIDFSHYTSDHVVEPRIGWTIKEMTDTGKGQHERFGYSNFKYLPLGQ